MQNQLTRIHLTTGDLFDIRRYGFQGVALFVPAGLTAFRVLSSDFVKAYGKPLSVSSPLEVFRVESDEVAPLVRIVRAANPRQRSFAKEDISLLVERAFFAFEDAGFVFDHAHEDGDAWYYSFDLLDKSIKISREYSRR